MMRVEVCAKVTSVPDEKIIEMVADGMSLKKLRAMALNNGMVSLQQDGIEKVHAGIVSIEEVLRTTQTEN